MAIRFIGSEHRANTTLRDLETEPHVVARPGGGFSIQWRYIDLFGPYTALSDGLMLRSFAADGTALDTEHYFQAQVSVLSQSSVAITNDNVVTIWTDGGHRTRAAITDPSGSVVVPAFEILADPAGNSRLVASIGLADGGFSVLIWNVAGAPQDPSISQEILSLYTFNADGTARGPAITLVTDSDPFNLIGSDAKLVKLDSGAILAIWEEVAPGGAGTFKGITVSPDGHAGPELTLAINSSISAVAVLPGDHILITSSRGNDTTDYPYDYDIVGRIVSASGSLIRDDFLISQATRTNQVGVRVASLPDGRFIAAWGSPDGVLARAFDANGNALTDEVVINSSNSGGDPSVAALPNGTFAISWVGRGSSIIDPDIFVRIIDLNGSDTNQAPTGILSGALNVSEHADVGTVVTQFTAVDPDANDTTDWYLIDDAQGRFGLVGNQLVVRTPNLFWEDRSSYDVTVRLRDSVGHTLDQTVTVNIIDTDRPVPGTIDMFRASPDRLLNTQIPGLQDGVETVGLTSGRYIAVWGSSVGGISARMIDENGVPIGSDFKVNSIDAIDQFSPTVTALATGGFFVAWVAQSEGSSFREIRGRIFDASGNAVGGDFDVSDDPFVSLYAPHLETLSNGHVVATWYGLDSAVRARVFSPTGSPVGQEIVVDAVTNQDTRINKAEAIALQNGHFAVLHTEGGPLTTTDVVARFFDSAGTLFSTVQIASDPNYFQYNGRGTSLANGGFAAAWVDERPSGITIRAKAFNSQGLATTAEIEVARAQGEFGFGTYEIYPKLSIAGLPDGRFVIAWNYDEPTAGSPSGASIRAQLFNADGSRVGEPFVVNTALPNNGFGRIYDQQSPDLAVSPTGDIFIAWTSREVEQVIGTDGDIRGQLYHVRPHFTEGNDAIDLRIARQTWSALAGNDRVGGTNEADTIFGGSGNDTITSRGGADLVDGGAGADSMDGGDGNDIYYVDNIGDITGETNAEQATGGFDIVMATANHTLGANIEQLVLRDAAVIGTGNDSANIIYGLDSFIPLNLSGMGGDDVIYGSPAGNSTISGGSGVDTMLMYGGNNTANGGTGSDIYFTYVASDVISEAGGDGIDTVYSAHSLTVAEDVEQVILFTTSATSATSNSVDDNNIMYGNSTGASVTLNGGGGADVLFGGSFADALNGGAGVDLLFGNGGADALAGGDDTDVYYLTSGTETITETLTGGFDTAYSNAAGTTLLATNVEQLILYGTATGGTGNGDANYLYGHIASNAVTLDGAGGADYLLDSAFSGDILIGGAGNDTLDVRTGGNDFIRYAAAGSNADTVFGFDADATGGQDLIDVSGRGFSAASIGGAITIAASGADTLVTIGTDTIRLIGVASANVTATDFMF